MEEKRSNNVLLYKYLGLGFQLILALAISVYAGIWLDKKFHLTIPLAVWILPLIVITAIIIKVIKDTSRK